ncbi:MAG: gamma carbonic anhydrase family protein, partial [Actinomycetota bacterium]|nr:gamma carbonic anhydrase family protein [Actinomycetota bacterium]
MALYAIGDRTPTIDPTAFVHPEAVIIGDVTIGAEASIWPSAVLRGDSGRVVVGAQTSVQDGTVVHCTSELDTVIGQRCVVGHRAHLEG